MDLSFGPEYDAYRKDVANFLAANWPPKAGKSDESVREFRAKAVEQGYQLRSIPKQYGGSEQPPDELRSIVIREEWQKAGAPGEYRGIGTMMFVPTLLERGTDWQKEKFVPKAVTGEEVWCQGYSEPGSGSDLASLKTKAELVGDDSRFLMDNLGVDILFYNGRPVGLTLPSHVVMEVTECEPGVKGDTATGATKGATLQTGYQVQVPLFIKVGDKLKIDTRNGNYVERVN